MDRRQQLNSVYEQINSKLYSVSNKINDLQNLILRTEGNLFPKTKDRIRSEESKILDQLDGLENTYRQKLYELGATEWEIDRYLLYPIDMKRRDLDEILFNLF